MDYLEVKKQTQPQALFKDGVNGVQNSRQNHDVRHSEFISNYLKVQRDVVVSGNAGPLIDDAVKLKQRIFCNSALPHPHLDASLNSVPVCVGLISIENIIPAFSYQLQVKSNQTYS